MSTHSRRERDHRGSRWGGPPRDRDDNGYHHSRRPDDVRRDHRNRPGVEGQDMRRRGGEERDQQGDRVVDRRPPHNHQSRKRPRIEDSKPRSGNAPRTDYYGPAAQIEDPEGSGKAQEGKPVEKTHKADFGLSGALAKDDKGGNVVNGVVLKFSEPPEARTPNTQWRLYVFKGKEFVETLHIAKQSAYLIGRNTEIADIPVLHPSLSGQHAVLQYRALPSKKDPSRLSCQPYIMDLESTNGTTLNGVKLDPARYYQVKKGDVITFGASTREYVMMTANTTSV